MGGLKLGVGVVPAQFFHEQFFEVKAAKQGAGAVGVDGHRESPNDLDWVLGDQGIA